MAAISHCAQHQDVRFDLAGGKRQDLIKSLVRALAAITFIAVFAVSCMVFLAVFAFR
jgi:hypothetical protein